MAAIDIGLDATTDDLPDDPVLITGLDLILQQISAVVNFFVGEWYLDERVGLPLVAWVQEKDPDTLPILATLEREIRSIDGVARTENSSAVFASQALTLQMDVITETGDVTTVSVVQAADPISNGAPFAISFGNQAISGAPAGV